MSKSERIAQISLASTLLASAAFGTLFGLYLGDRIGLLLWGGLFFAQCSFLATYNIYEKRRHKTMMNEIGAASLAFQIKERALRAEMSEFYRQCASAVAEEVRTLQ